MKATLSEFIQMKEDEPQSATSNLFVNFSQGLLNSFTRRVDEQLEEFDDGSFDIDAMQSIWREELKNIL